MQLKRQLGQAGDTIVEVLIAIAVISAVLGSAYAITNNSVKSNQEAQEHSAALKVAESQLEQLKGWMEKGNTVPGTGSNFCMYVGADNSNQLEQSGENLPSTDASKYPANCKKAHDTVTDRFLTIINRTGDTYTVHVDWDGPKGIRDSVSMVYRVYQ